MVSGTSKKGLNFLIILGAWTLWRLQNDRVFNGSSPRFAMVLTMAGEEAMAWGTMDAKGLALLTGQEMAAGQ
jgi:hypothetical protein